MGIVSSKEKKPTEQESITEAQKAQSNDQGSTNDQKTESKQQETVGAKRPIQIDDPNFSSPRSKRKPTKKEYDEKKGGGRVGLEERPEHLGPREPRIPKKKVALLIGYNGTGYQGLQLNQNASSIEGELFNVLCKVNAISKDNATDPKKSAWMRAARTDKGIVQRINDLLPPQIRVWGFVPVINSFNPKNLCDSRVYEYLLPTCAFMAPTEKTLTTEPSHENDLKLVTPEGEYRYTTRSTPKELEERHQYRATNDQINIFKQALKCFEGTHNFHNYTNGKSFKEKSANRFIKSIDVSEPIYIDGSEWLSIKLHGQSFMLHQIRKMIAMALLVTRTKTPISLISQSFEENRINIPKAPALGLLLERPIFKVYNEKTRIKASNEVKRDKIDFDLYNDKIEEFKHEWIYKKIFETEHNEHVFDGYLTSLDAHVGPDYLYLNDKGVIPKECLVETKFNKKGSDEEEDE
ncbi:pseudouridine synthase [Cokeromyces recurvatus]|uniref:pseudouridine synthase n=1 Tax=Cokeromyces recurvatus TaxID=90255 RepID=UPI0022205EDE|nr:pseudouridine synthase [Cokeromyces recurvatus]KAI7898542.1 pseudouridine synthase [Cokeromyces recurvatus]